jgi:tetratricopeptide (TPR) repeat protein
MLRARRGSMTDAKTHYLSGLKLFGQNQWEAAIAEYRKALELKPGWTDLLNALATAHSKAGDQEQAIRVIEQAIQIDPNDAFAFTSLSIFLQRNGKIPEAEAAAAKARMINWKEELKKNPNAPPPAGAGEMKVVQ